ncbi:hypothetical protein ACWD7F_15965 [Streptomyces sp. NPDC005122]
MTRVSDVSGCRRRWTGRGTSLSAPEFSAIQAHHGRPIGFANPSLYTCASTRAYHDVIDQAATHHKAPLNAVYDAGVIDGLLRARLIGFGQDTSLNATKGYDNATGVRTPTENYLNSFK